MHGPEARVRDEPRQHVACVAGPDLGIGDSLLGDPLGRQPGVLSRDLDAQVILRRDSAGGVGRNSPLPEPTSSSTGRSLPKRAVQREAVPGQDAPRDRAGRPRRRSSVASGTSWEAGFREGRLVRRVRSWFVGGMIERTCVRLARCFRVPAIGTPMILPWKTMFVPTKPWHSKMVCRRCSRCPCR